MSSSIGRGHALAASVLLAGQLVAFTTQPARAQEGREEVIADPDLAEDAKTGNKTPSSDAEVIVDPELAGTSSPAASEGDEEAIVDPELQAISGSGEEERDYLANTGVARIEVVGQQQFDLRHEGGLEDAFESRLSLETEVDFRRSRKLRLSIGVRTDFFWGVPSPSDPAIDTRDEEGNITHDTDALGQDRFELDILPVSGFLDVTLADGLHLRIGEQIVTMARMDFYSPIDMLAVYDLRGQAKFVSGIPKLAQPAVRMDLDLSHWTTLQLIYVPWFMPHVSRGNRDRYVARILGSSDQGLPAFLDELIDPSFQTKAPEQALRFIGPPPDFTNPQVEARLALRGSGKELAFSGGTALEKVPMIYTTPAVADAAFGNPAAAALALAQGIPLLDVQYHRYYQVGVDGNFDLGPLTLNVEFAYSPSRQLYTHVPSGMALPQPNTTDTIVNGTPEDGGNVRDKSIRKGVPLVQGALHIEYFRDLTFAIVMEGFWINAMELPYDGDRDWWGFIPGTGAFVGGMVGLMYGIKEGLVTFSVTALAAPGPSVVGAGQIEFRINDELFLNVGVQAFEGPAPIPYGGRVNVGGLFSGNDHVSLGFRYTP